MDVAVLPPQNLLKRHYKHYTNHHSRRLISPTKTQHHPNSNPNPNAPRSNNRRRRNSNSPPPSSGPTPKAQLRSQSPDPAQPVMGQVRILKRGETVKPVKQVAPPPPPPPPQMMGPVGPMRDAFGFYAGSACVSSPPPSELPLPAFFMKVVAADNNQKIASDLRRALNIC